MKNFLTWIAPCLLVTVAFSQRPGDGERVDKIHPNYTLEKIRPTAMNWPIGAMDFLSDGRMVVTSWKDPYGVFILSNVTSGKASQVTMKEYATGLSEMFGVKVVNDSIYVLQKEELTLLLDHDGDGTADEYRAIAYDWTKSPNEKEYAFGLPFDGTYFYGAFGDPTVNSGTSVDPVPAGRQNGVLRINKVTGVTEPFTAGLRVPGGMGQGFGEIWTTETQGGFRVEHVLYNAKLGRYYGRPINPPAVYQTLPYNATPPEYNTADQTAYTHFSVNIPYSGTGGSGMPAGGGLGRSPGNPLAIEDGVFAGQMLIPDCDDASTPAQSGGINRIFLEKMPNGEFQGAALHFSMGFEGVGVFNIARGTDGNIYAGANGSNAAGWERLTHVGLDRLKLNGTSAFDILAVRSMGPNTFEFEFTKPLATSLGANVAQHLEVQKWWNKLTNTYGCCRQTLATVSVTSATVSTDRKKVTVTLSGLTLHWIYHFHWKNDALVTDAAEKLWGTEAWYTLNAFGPGSMPVAIQEPRRTSISGPISIGRNSTGLQIELAFASDEKFQLRLLDLQGKVFATRFGQGRMQMQFSPETLPTGLFIVKVQSGNRLYSRYGFK